MRSRHFTAPGDELLGHMELRLILSLDEVRCRRAALVCKPEKIPAREEQLPRARLQHGRARKEVVGVSSMDGKHTHLIDDPMPPLLKFCPDAAQGCARHLDPAKGHALHRYLTAGHCCEDPVYDSYGGHVSGPIRDCKCKQLGGYWDVSVPVLREGRGSTPSRREHKGSSN